MGRKGLYVYLRQAYGTGRLFTASRAAAREYVALSSASCISREGYHLDTFPLGLSRRRILRFRVVRVPLISFEQITLTESIDERLGREVSEQRRGESAC